MTGTSALLLVRKALFDRRIGVFGYEVLHREADEERHGLDAIQAILRVGVENIVGEKKLFIPVGPAILETSFLDALPADRVIPILKESALRSPSAEPGIVSLLEKGFKFGVEVEKVGVALTGEAAKAKYAFVDLENQLHLCTKPNMDLTKHGGRRAIGRGVFAHSVLQKIWNVGFEYFQGAFVMEPLERADRKIPQNRAVLLNLVAKLQDPSVKLDALEMLVASDVVLSYRLMRLVNSASVGLEQHVDSIRQALMMLGYNRISSLVSMLVMAGVKDKPSELAMIGMIRGKMAEAIAKKLNLGEPGMYFTLGLLSVLPALFDQPMGRILEELPLSAEMASALGDEEDTSSLGNVLRLVKAYESANWSFLDSGHISLDDIANSYFEALEWSVSALSNAAA